MAEDLKKQLEAIKEQQRKINKVKKAIVKEFIVKNEELKSVLSYSNEIDKLEGLIDEIQEGYYNSVRKPIVTVFLRLAEITKFTINEHGTIWGDIPPSLKEELRGIGRIRSFAYSLKFGDGLYIGVYDEDCTKFAITGGAALQFVLDNFALDWSEYERRLEKQVQDTIEAKERSMKTYDDRLNTFGEKLLLLNKYKDSE